jgi:hypothetical protein
MLERVKKEKKTVINFCYGKRVDGRRTPPLIINFRLEKSLKSVGEDD